MAQNSISSELNNLLITHDFDVDALSTRTGKPAVNERGVPDVSEADMFSFDWVGPTGKNYGTMVILLDQNGGMTVYFGDNLGRTMDPEDKKAWYGDSETDSPGFLEQLKNFAIRTSKVRGGFGLENLSKLKYAIAGQAALTESFYGTRKVSYSGEPTEARLMIRHTRPISEGDKRYRYVDSLFIETAQGERFRLPFRKLAGGRAMLEHVRQGGNPYDLRGQHIAETVNQLNVLSQFRRAHQGRVFEGAAGELVSETDQYRQRLNHNLKHMATSRGYRSYFESWKPADISEGDIMVEDLRGMFVETRIDPRIESALPMLAKIQQEARAMKEAEIFESWAERLVEGRTWALPDTPEKMTEIKTWFSQPRPLGPDAEDVTVVLYELLGDDALFDQLAAMAEEDPTADAVPLVQAWVTRNKDQSPELGELAMSLTTTAAPAAAPAAPAPAPAAASPAVPVAEGLTEMDKSQTPPGRDGGTQFPPGPKVSKKDREAAKKNPAKHLSDLFAKEYDKKKQGVTEGFPQPGPSSGAPKQFGPDAKIQTRQMTVKDIISSVPGVPYYNNVVDDWDAKDYSWGVTKKVIEYATYLKDHPESLAKLPPAIVLNGKFEDGAHRVSAIWLLQQRMDPKNPLWKNAKLNVQFVKQGVAGGHADQQRKIFKKNGQPVGEVGIDRESSPGVGQWYMKCYAYDIDNSGYDSYEEAVAELKHCLKQGVASGSLNELKKSTVKSYADKKQAELDDVLPMPFKKPAMSKAEHEKAAKGMTGALARLSGQKPTSQGVAEGDNLQTFEDIIRLSGAPMNENVMTDHTRHTLKHILHTFGRDVRDFIQHGELSAHLYDALYDYYHEDMPYGVAKARTGDPYEWISDRLSRDLSDHGMLDETVPTIAATATPEFNNDPAPVSECNYTMENEYCPVHGLAECSSSSMFESELARIKSLMK